MQQGLQGAHALLYALLQLLENPAKRKQGLFLIDVMNMANKNKISMDWSKISVVSVIAFLAGWIVFGLLGAVVLALGVLALMGILRVR